MLKELPRLIDAGAVRRALVPKLAHAVPFAIRARKARKERRDACPDSGSPRYPCA